MTGWSTARSACCARSIRRPRFRALDRRRRRRRPAAFRAIVKAARWALDRFDGVDVVVQADEPRWKQTARRRHGFDHHRPGMHRRARRLCRPEGQGRADHRAGDAGRARLLSGALARAGTAARRARPERARAAASTNGCMSLRAPRRWSRRCAQAGRAACSSPADSSPSPSRSREAVGFDRVRANRLVFAGGKLSGEVGDPIVDAMAKREALIEAREQLGLGAT